MSANRGNASKPEENKGNGINIIYSARDNKRVLPHESKPPQTEIPSFPSPPNVPSRKPTNLPNTISNNGPRFPPKSPRVAPRPGELKVKQSPSHRCRGCGATFVTIGEMFLHQTLKHNGEDLRETSPPDRAVAPIPRFIAPQKRTNGRITTEERGDASRREQRKLWNPPLSTRPKRWNSGSPMPKNRGWTEYDPLIPGTATQRIFAWLEKSEGDSTEGMEPWESDVPLRGTENGFSVLGQEPSEACGSESESVQGIP